MATKLDAVTIYELATWIGNLEATVRGENVHWGAVQEYLRSLGGFRNTESVEFIGKEAQSKLRSLSKKYKSPSRKLDDDDTVWLVDMVTEWYGRTKEISKKWVICMPQTGIDVAKLVAGAKDFFDDQEWNILSELEKQGLNEAAASLLGNNFTASEFMALRTVESVLRRWYEKRKGLTVKNIKWGTIIDTLDEEFPEKSRPTPISALFHFKSRRNAVAHPDLISNEADASVTFVYVINTCKAMKGLLLTP